jgi:hypothetical protein
MKALNAHLFHSIKSTPMSVAGGKNDLINPKIYLKILNYNLDQRKIKIYTVLAEISKVISTRLLSPDNMDFYAGGNRYALQLDADQILNFDHVQKIDVSSYKDTFYDPDWGFAFNQRDAELKLRESNFGLKFVNSILHYLSIYNQLNRFTLFGKMLINEVNKNVSLVTGTGLNGMIFASTLSPNPSYPPSQFIRNIYNLVGQGGLKEAEFDKRVDQLERAAARIEDSSIGTLEKRLFNPLFDSFFDEWGGNLYGFTGKYIDELNTFRVLCEHITLEIDAIADLIFESKKELSSPDASTSPDNPLFELLGVLCDVCVNHLTYLAHVVTNTYFGLNVKAEDDRLEVDDVKRRIINSVSSFLHNLHLNSGYSKDATPTASQAYDMIQTANYYGLFILSQFAEDTNTLVNGGQFSGLAGFVKSVIGSSPDKLLVAVQCYTLLIKIHPDSFNSMDLETLLSHLKNPQLSDSDYRSICQFLVACCDSPRLRKTVATQQTLNAIVSCKRFLDRPSFLQMSYYQGEQRDSEFCNWIWTLNVMIHAFGPLKENTGSVDAILSFVRAYMNRILSVLGFQFVNVDINQPNSRLVIDADIRSRNECFRSTAYVEELELTLTLIDLLINE